MATVDEIIVGTNSYAYLTEADEYLANSIRGNGWEFLTDTTKKRALLTAHRIIDRLRWKGVMNSLELVSSVTAVADGGSGYAVNDLIAEASGNGTVAAIFKVTTVSGGVITAVQMVHQGLYATGNSPSTTVATTALTGSGTGATLTLVGGATQTLQWPRTGVTDRYGDSVSDSAYPQDLRYGQIELAWELTQDEGVETSQGLGANEKRLKAGDVEIENFRPTGGPNGRGSQRLPGSVHEFLAQFLNYGSATLPYFGTRPDDAFDDDSRYDHSVGYD